jgi:hypothetical protein
MRNINIPIKISMQVAFENDLIIYLDSIAKKSGVTRTAALRKVIRDHRAASESGASK